MKVTRFFRTPKGLLILLFAFLLQRMRGQFGLYGPGVAYAALTGMTLDAVILRVRRKRWVFPDGALLTALIVAMILSPHEAWYVPVATTALAIVSKYAVRVRKANVFNPAALALVVAFYAFGTAQDWWGAAGDARFGAVVVALLGLFIAHRVDRLPAAVAFLLVYYTLATIAAFAGDPAHVAELYRTPDVNAALYFAFFMVTDPPTSPTRYRDQVTFGVIAGVGAYAAFAIIGAVYFLLAGVLAANVWAAVRRMGAVRAQPVSA